MARMGIRWEEESRGAMESKDAAGKGADSARIKITSNGNEYWFNWNECWFLETTSTNDMPILNTANHFTNKFTESSNR